MSYKNLEYDVKWVAAQIKVWHVIKKLWRVI